MPNDNPIIPAPQTGLDTAVNGWDVNEVLASMNELLQAAVVQSQLHNVREVETCVRQVDAIYANNIRFASHDDVLLMGMLRGLCRLFNPLVRANAFQIEGRFAKAREEISRGLITVQETLKIADEYALLANADANIVEAVRPIVLVISIMLDGMDASIEAEIIGYQGDIVRYIEKLKASVLRFRQIDRLPPSSNPFFVALATACTTLADRLETRAEVFASLPKAPRALPGNRIFIVHGHDEAKWRELRDILEDRFKLKTTVLKEEAGAGETLIAKFEEYAANCCYAFVLFTPDDFVEKNGETYFQARPNVLFELGWFYGAFGRDRVCIVKNARTAMPSDLGGILSIDFHDKVAEGYVQIEDELRRAGVIK